MPNHDNDSCVQSRRRFLGMTLAVVGSTLLAGLYPRGARGADQPHVTPSDPTAKALGYVDDASTSKDPKHKAGDKCANCQFYSGGPTGFGPCQLFPGKDVSSQGWCISHTPKKT